MALYYTIFVINSMIQCVGVIDDTKHLIFIVVVNI